MQVPICPGTSTILNGIPTCSDGWDMLDATATEFLLTGGFSVEAFEIGFAGIFGLWVAGLTIGLIISIIRKAR